MNPEAKDPDVSLPVAFVDGVCAPEVAATAIEPSAGSFDTVADPVSRSGELQIEAELQRNMLQMLIIAQQYTAKPAQASATAELCTDAVPTVAATEADDLFRAIVAEPGATAAEAFTTAVEPPKPPADLETTAAEPPVSLVEPVATAAEPGATAVEPPGPLVEPPATAAEPPGLPEEPDATAAELNSTAVEPVATTAHASNAAMEVSQQGALSHAVAEPAADQQADKSSQEKVPDAERGEASTHAVESSVVERELTAPTAQGDPPGVARVDDVVGTDMKPSVASPRLQPEDVGLENDIDKPAVNKSLDGAEAAEAQAPLQEEGVSPAMESGEARAPQNPQKAPELEQPAQELPDSRYGKVSQIIEALVQCAKRKVEKAAQQVSALDGSEVGRADALAEEGMLPAQRSAVQEPQKPSPGRLPNGTSAGNARWPGKASHMRGPLATAGPSLRDGQVLYTYSTFFLSFNSDLFKLPP